MSSAVTISLLVAIVVQSGAILLLILWKKQSSASESASVENSEVSKEDEPRVPLLDELFSVEEGHWDLDGSAIALTSKAEMAAQHLIASGMQAYDISTLFGRRFKISLNGNRLHDLEQSGFLSAGTKESVSDSEEKYYLITDDGELGVISQVSNLNAVTTGLTAWKLLAFITATKFLSDINDRLTKIELGISRIERWLLESRAAEIRGNLEYLESAMAFCRTRSVKEEESQILSNQIEAIERQCRQHTIALKIEWSRCNDSFREIYFPDRDTKKTRGKTEKVVSSFRQCARARTAVLGIRLAAAQVRFALAGYSELLEARLDEILEELSLQKRDQTEFFRLVNQRLDALGADAWQWFSKDYNWQQRKVLEVTLDQTEQNLREVCSSFEAVAEGTVAEIQRAKSPGEINLYAMLSDTGKVTLAMSELKP